MSIKSWTRSSYSYHHNTTAPTAMTGNFAAFPVTYDFTNSPESELFPDVCNIQTVEFDFTVKGSASTVYMYVARDSDGKCAITPGNTSGASQLLTEGASGTASAVFKVDADFHFDSSVANATTGTIYVMAKVNDAGGSPTANIRVNWRG
tara:strand:- start:721 stop:1167 length:447 start_codon:yes stop_codon:yes gene_type:complete